MYTVHTTLICNCSVTVCKPQLSTLDDLVTKQSHLFICLPKGFCFSYTFLNRCIHKYRHRSHHQSLITCTEEACRVSIILCITATSSHKTLQLQSGFITVKNCLFTLSYIIITARLCVDPGINICLYYKNYNKAHIEHTHLEYVAISIYHLSFYCMELMSAHTAVGTQEL